MTGVVGLLLVAGTVASGPAVIAPGSFAQPARGFQVELPRDHGAHSDFRSEWWYFTGNVRSAEQHAYGFKLTFFRNRMAPDAALEEAFAGRVSPLLAREVHAVNLAVSDLDQRRLLSSERVGRAGFSQAGASALTFAVHNHDVRGSIDANGIFHLNADDAELGLSLALAPDKSCVMHGRDGVHQKAADPIQTSHYLSCTRLAVSGTLRIAGRDIAVTGDGWMDHEWGSSAPALFESGWDWFGLQLDNGQELMVYQLRQAAGEPDPVHFGSLIHADSRVEELAPADSVITATGQWSSPASGARYPMGWRITLPRHQGDLEVTPVFEDQEMRMMRSTGVTYWEGAVRVRGRLGGVEVTGHGYTELVGYAAMPATRARNR